jgi:Nucleotide-diphospho-sugar transferase
MNSSFSQVIVVTLILIMMTQYVFHVHVNFRSFFRSKFLFNSTAYKIGPPIPLTASVYAPYPHILRLQQQLAASETDITSIWRRAHANSSAQTEPAPPRPDLCVVLTFPATSEALKHQAHANTAGVYNALLPRVLAFVAQPVPPEAAGAFPRVLPRPAANAHGTPLFRSLVSLVADACPDAPLLAYANSDILFDAGLLDTLDALLEWDQPEFVAVGRRRNHDLRGALTIHDIAGAQGDLFTEVGQDYFIFPRRAIEGMATLPPYVIGRRAYDNAINDWAFHRSCLVDLTETVVALHQTTSDGNYAGHSDKNPDKEYNVKLPNAVYDHGSTLHAQYATVRRGSRVVVIRRGDNSVVAEAPQGGNASSVADPYNITRRGQPVPLDSLPSPLLVVFGNDGYREMLASFLCNTAAFPPMHAHTLVIVTAQATLDYLAALDTDAAIGLFPDALQTGYDYDTPDYLQLMLLRGRAVLPLLGARAVLLLEADAEYSGNLLAHPAVEAPSADLTLYWDGTMFGGGFILFAPTAAARDFYASVMARLQSGIAQGDFTNDQFILNQELDRQPNVTRAEFDRCQFRSGLFYSDDRGAELRVRCQNARPMVQQHNWVVGNGRKIDLAKEHGAWYLSAETPAPVCARRDLRVLVMTMDRPSSLHRLLLSLRAAHYPQGARVDVRVTVDRRPDAPHDDDTMALLAEFDWRHGFFEVHAWPEPVGIFGQWVDAWPCEQFPSGLYRAAVLLEDDLEVSPAYFEWFVGAHEAYAAPDLGAVTGMRAQLVAQTGVPQTVAELVPQGVQVFAYRLIATWSMSPTHDAWRRFRAWVKIARADPGYDPAVDGTHPGDWYRAFKAAGTHESMWEIWFLRFMHDQNLYTLYPWIDGGARTVVCNWRERGLHYDGDPARDFPLVSSLPANLLAQAVVPYVDWGLAFPPWPVVMTNPEIRCVSGNENLTCEALASRQGPSWRDLAADEQLAMAKQTPQGWPSGPVAPAVIRANGDVVLCEPRVLYSSAGCGDATYQEDHGCPAHPGSTVEYAVAITQYWGEGYFHMVVEGPPRLAQAIHDHPAFFARAEPIHVHTPSPHAIQFLRLMGLAHVISGDVLVTQGLLVAPPTPCGGHVLSPHARWLRSRLLVL